ncbi:methylamine utilization protein MauD [Sandarakinorhabdus sp.]|jgi:methylamine dehydrogenase accessory protein MauD|uniref:methylamine utilization protein MauD n=1 Tax=Sandarakinorhabdus sp. TaxID=1916663 RepID=UPI003340F5C1
MFTLLIINEALQWLVLIALGVAGLALARQVGVLHVRVAPAGALDANRGPAVGDVAPPLAVTTLDGRPYTVGGVSATASLRLLMFVSAQCPMCKSLIPVAKSFAAAERISLVFVGDDTPAIQQSLVTAQGLDAYPFINSDEVGRLFEVDKLPHAVLMDGAGKILAKGLVNSREHLESLIVSHEMGVASVQDYIAGLKPAPAKPHAAATA